MQLVKSQGTPDHVGPHGDRKPKSKRRMPYAAAASKGGNNPFDIRIRLQSHESKLKCRELPEQAHTHLKPMTDAQLDEYVASNRFMADTNAALWFVWPHYKWDKPKMDEGAKRFLMALQRQGKKIVLSSKAAEEICELARSKHDKLRDTDLRPAELQQQIIAATNPQQRKTLEEDLVNNTQNAIELSAHPLVRATGVRGELIGPPLIDYVLAMGPFDLDEVPLAARLGAYQLFLPGHSNFDPRDREIAFWAATQGCELITTDSCLMASDAVSTVWD